MTLMFKNQNIADKHFQIQSSFLQGTLPFSPFFPSAVPLLFHPSSVFSSKSNNMYYIHI